ncbi:MAG TPA: phenylacetate-CoA oxygenase subunit PaaC [Beijerinckiaceae bacterium]|nr:phenylacetate-CoA oxygenase subunit PaaC [Beijerinckiaceae bacterium]
MSTPLFDYTIRLADTALVLGHRLSEWCGHAPILEEDMALANLALDLIGQSRSFYDYAGAVEGKGRDENALAYLRLEPEWKNLLIVEQPNGDFAATILRQFLVAAFLHPFYRRLSGSKDATLAAIAAKAEKEMAYHVRHCGEWVIRLGDGTAESHRRISEALADLWPFTGEMFEVDAGDRALIEQGIAVDAVALRAEWEQLVDRVFAEATLERPGDSWMQTGGRNGRHTEHLGHLLAELQYMQRAHPGLTW